MSYDSIERSRDESQPIYCYSFALAGTVWRATSSAFDVVAGGHTWLSEQISDDGVKQSGEASTDALTITAPLSFGPVQIYLQNPPSSPIHVKIYHMQKDNATMYACYAGEISQVNLAKTGSARITCETLSASMKRRGLRLGWQRSCPYAVYDPVTCKVPKASFAVAGFVLDSQNGILTMEFGTPHDPGYLSGGFIEWMLPVRGMEFRSIETHGDGTLTIFGPTDDIFPGQDVTCYPGCNLTTDHCINKFDNYLEYGGISRMPGKSPFDGTPVF